MSTICLAICIAAAAALLAFFAIVLRQRLWSELAEVSGRVFLSYRRKPTRDFAQLFKERLEKELGAGTVFLDEGAIEEGEKFPPIILTAVARSDVVLVLFEANWELERLKNPHDYVRQEIELATAREIAIPVRIDGCDLPVPESLPEEIRAILKPQALDLYRQPKRFTRDVREIAKFVKSKSSSIALRTNLRCYDLKTQLLGFGSVILIVLAASIPQYASTQSKARALEDALEKESEVLQRQLDRQLRVYPFTFEEFVERYKARNDTSVDLKDMQVIWEGIFTGSHGEDEITIKPVMQSPYQLTMKTEKGVDLSKQIKKLEKNDRIKFVGQIHDLSTPYLMKGELTGVFPLN